MLKRVHYKLIFLGVLVLLGVLFSIPTFTNNLPGWWGKIMATEGMRLGLDLQGGMHLILRVNLSRAVQNNFELSVSDLREALRKKKIPVSKIETVELNRVRVSLPASAPAESLKDMLTEDFSNLTVLSESSQEGGIFLELGLKANEIKTIRENSVAHSLEIIRNRIDQFGVSEPVILQQGSDEIVVQLPGVRDPKRAMDLIGRTAQLEFKLVDSDANTRLSALVSEAISSGRLKENYTRQELTRALKISIPPEDEVYLLKEVARDSGRKRMVPILLKKKTMMTGEAIKTARVQIGGAYSEPSVGLSFNTRGARVFERVTEENVGKRLAIILDDVVQSAPVIQERISGGNAQITGSFSTEEAGDLAIVLRAGALPAPVDIIQNLTVGPSLGRDSIEKGIVSTIVGGILVVCFMATYYRVSGMIANCAVILNLILMVASLSLFRATLTLPGIAGIVLSIGMAVDSNVLIFERMREEFVVGKALRPVVNAGYDKALWTIIDSHVTTLITAFALFLFGTGPIKGFAVTLSMGVIFNLFTALYGTKVGYEYLDTKHWIKTIRFLQFIKKPNIDFIGLRKMAFIFSGVLVLLGLFSFVQISRGKANLGVEFAGGTLLQFRAEKDFRLEDVRAALGRHDLPEYELQEVPEQRVLIVRIKKTGLSVGAAGDQVAAILTQELPQNPFVTESTAEIGSSVSNDLKRAALIAIGISMAGIIIYLAWRFDFSFGVAAAIATFHDVLAVLGIFYLLEKEITLLIVTALLTLAGYSLTDTVVVFDRIRENLRKKGTKDLGGVINQSINEVLSRTIITSTTVFLVLVALFFLGGIIIHDFALALILGVIIGTYSSIFVASPILYIWPSRKRPKRAFAAKGNVYR